MNSFFLGIIALVLVFPLSRNAQSRDSNARAFYDPVACSVQLRVIYCSI